MEHPSPPNPGFVTVIVDLPFLLGIPNDTYVIHDPVKEIALLQTVQREGSVAVLGNVLAVTAAAVLTPLGLGRTHNTPTPHRGFTSARGRILSA